jgi:hypothetical protein
MSLHAENLVDDPTGSRGVHATDVDRAVTRLRSRWVPERGTSWAPEEGDIIFGNRLSWMQRVMNVSGDYLSHCGIIARVDGQLAVIEVGPGGCFSRTLEDFVAAYRFIAYLRPRMHPACLRQVVEAATSELDRREATYSNAACWLLEAFMLGRRYLPAACEPLLNRLGNAAASWLVDRSESSDVTCSGFLFDCLSAACDRCRPQLSWPVRPRTSPWIMAPWLTDVRSNPPDPASKQHPQVTRALIMPYDLWAAIRFDHKVVVDNGQTTVIVDYVDTESLGHPLVIAS